MGWLEPLVAGAAVVLADQLSKRHVLARPRLRAAPERRPFFAIQYVVNRRAAVMPLRAPWLLVGLWISCAVLALLSLTRGPLVESVSAAIGIGMVFGGITGNLIDRLRRGGTVDFIAIRPWVFNIADVAIVGGFALVLWALV